MSKIYAVRVGRKTGKFYSWEECRKQVIGYPNAQYKSFDKEEDAEWFLKSDPVFYEDIDLQNIESYTFVDGSFNDETNVYGYGGFLVHKGTKYILQGSGTDKDMALMRNISGEVLGAKAGVQKAIELGLKEIYVIYDYVGIELWGLGKWVGDNEGTKAYCNYMKEAGEKIKIVFVKVEGHSNVEGNEEADRLAKEAVGIK